MFKKVKEIRSKTGELHFTRWSIFSFKRLNINLFLHKIEKADDDKHPHDHPWNFFSLILHGGYVERIGDSVYVRRPGSFSYKNCTKCHRVLALLGKAVYTLVFTFGEKRTWGYQTPTGWVDFETYRENKRN